MTKDKKFLAIVKILEKCNIQFARIDTTNDVISLRYRFFVPSKYYKSPRFNFYSTIYYPTKNHDVIIKENLNDIVIRLNDKLREYGIELTDVKVENTGFDLWGEDRRLVIYAKLVGSLKYDKKFEEYLLGLILEGD